MTTTPEAMQQQQRAVPTYATAKTPLARMHQVVRLSRRARLIQKLAHAGRSRAAAPR